MRIIKYLPPLLLALSLWLSGCAHVQPPSKETRVGFGTVGVVSSGTVVKGDFGAPTSGKGTGALKGAGGGALGSIAGGLKAGVSSGQPLGLALGVALGVGLSPVIALGGTVYGAVAAEPKAKVMEAEDSINNALKDIDIRQAMLIGVFKAARERTSCNVVPVFVSVREGPATPTGEGVDVGYKDLKGSGVDTALVVDVTQYRLGPAGINPPLSLILEARVRLVRCLDGKELYANTFTYKGQQKKYLEWASGGAKPLVGEINTACDVLSRQVVDEALLGVPTVPYTPKQRYLPGFEPEAGTSLHDLFEPADKHGWGDEEGHPW